MNPIPETVSTEIDDIAHDIEVFDRERRDELYECLLDLAQRLQARGIPDDVIEGGLGFTLHPEHRKQRQDAA